MTHIPDAAVQAAVIKPVTNIDCRTSQEVFDIMCDRIHALYAKPAQGEQLKRIGFIDYFSMTAIKHGADFSEITISKAASDIHTYPIYAAPTTEAEVCE